MIRGRFACDPYAHGPMDSQLPSGTTARGRHLSRGGSLGTRFRLFWFGQAVSQFGDYLSYLALPLFVVSISDRSISLAIIYSLDTIPTILFGLFGGVLLDRLRLRRFMIFGDIGRTAAFLALARIAWLVEHGDRLGLVAIFVLAFAVGMFSAGFINAMFTIIPFLVKKSKLTVANSRVAATQNIAFALGPVAAGLLIDSVGFWVTFVINAATFLVSAACLVLIGPVDREAPPEQRLSALREALHGLRFVWREMRLRVSTVAAALANFVVGFLESTYVLLAADIGAVSGTDVGLIFAAFGIGAILGALTAPLAVRLLGLGRCLVVGLGVFAVAMLVFANSTFCYVTLLLPLVAHIGLQWVNVPLATIRQAFTPQVILGRVMTATRAIGWALLPLGAVVGATLADTTGYTIVVRVAPIILVLVAAALVPTVLWRDTFKPPEQEPQESPA